MRFPTPEFKWGLVLFALAATTQAWGQIPDEFKNLKVLPEGISKGELVGTMRGFAGALGVRCSHCHPGPDNLQGMDFASDELETKRVARAMMTMTREINQTLLPATKRESVTTVECATCHRGLQDPQSLRGLLADVVKEAGAADAATKYRELRETYHGSGSYDFSPRTLNGLAETLARQGGDVEGAIVLMQLNVEFNPDAAYSHLLLGQLHASSGNKQAAKKSIERAIELDPENRWAKQALERVKAMSDPD